MANEGSILSKIPAEIWLKVISNLDDELDQIMLSRACRLTRNLFAFEAFAMVATRLLRKNQLKILKSRLWNDLVVLDSTHQLLGRAACGACKRAHGTSAFEEEMLKKPASDRACLGARGLFRVCEHKVVDFKDIQIALKNQRFTLLCGEHPRKDGDYDERVFWDLGLMKVLVQKKLVPNYEDECDVVGIRTSHQCLPTGFERALERKFLDAILANDQEPICRHLRRCDLMATYSKDVDHWWEDTKHAKFCSHPCCLTAYTFAGVRGGSITLEVVQYFGMAFSPLDPYWLEAISEVKEAEKLGGTKQIQTDHKREVDTKEDGVDGGEEENEHPLLGSAHEDVMAQLDIMHATSRHPPGDDYPRNPDDDCMCIGGPSPCLDCTARRRNMPLPRWVSKPRGGDWVCPGDLGFYVYL